MLTGLNITTYPSQNKTKQNKTKILEEDSLSLCLISSKECFPIFGIADDIFDIIFTNKSIITILIMGFCEDKKGYVVRKFA